MRCLTLADALRRGGISSRFVTREHEGNLASLIESRGHTVSLLPAPKVDFKGSGTPANAGWLGAPWEVDAHETAAALSGGKLEWLIVDHYGIDRRWESALRGTAKRLMVIDDLADRAHDCDLLLDQNLVADMSRRYEHLVPELCTTLLGPRYALLGQEYAELHENARARSGSVRRVFIFFGGNSAGLTEAAVSAFLKLEHEELEADVVIPVNSDEDGALRRLIGGRANVTVYSDLPSLAPLIAAADIGLGASGATSWERLCLGLPTLVVTVADNQRPIADEASRRGVARLLGEKESVTAESIRTALSEMIDSGIDPEWSKRCRAVVDGKGSSRVYWALVANVEMELNARDAVVADEEQLLELANDPGTRRNAFSHEAISVETHHAWLRSRLMRPESCRIYIVGTSDGTAAGQVRFEAEADGWEVHYSVAPELRRRGLGRSLLRAALIVFGESHPGARIFGRVKEQNVASRRIFDALGFEQEGNGKSAIITYRRAL